MAYFFFLVRQISRSLWKKASRKGLRLVLRFASQDRRVAAERWWRGREDFRKLRLADFVVVSFGKSGRTWLRTMISRIYQLQHGLSERYLIGFDNLHYKNPAIPKILFTHDNYIKDYTGHYDSKADFYNKRVVLLVRDPRDVAVSQFFQWKHRMKPVKKVINDYPPHGEDVSVFQFVTKYEAGLPKVIKFMNTWAEEAPKLEGLLVVRYEDLKASPAQTLKGVMEFLGTPATDEQVTGAVDFASYDNMKKMEQGNVFWLSGGRLVPRDKSDPNSYKVRRGKVGGYRDYFEDDQVVEVDALLDSSLHSLYGYTAGAEQTSGREAAASH